MCLDWSVKDGSSYRAVRGRSFVSVLGPTCFKEWLLGSLICIILICLSLWIDLFIQVFLILISMLLLLLLVVWGILSSGTLKVWSCVFIFYFLFFVFRVRVYSIQILNDFLSIIVHIVKRRVGGNLRNLLDLRQICRWSFRDSTKCTICWILRIQFVIWIFKRIILNIIRQIQCLRTFKVLIVCYLTIFVKTF